MKARRVFQVVGIGFGLLVAGGASTVALASTESTIAAWHIVVRDRPSVDDEAWSAMRRRSEHGIDLANPWSDEAPRPLVAHSATPAPGSFHRWRAIDTANPWAPELGRAPSRGPDGF